MPLSLKNNPNFFLRVTSLSFLVSIWLTMNLWKSSREFPLFPVIESLEVLQIDTAIAVWAILAILVQFIFVQFKVQRFMPILIVLFVVLIFLDQMRLQPWVYLFLLMIYPFAVTKDKTAIINYLRILFAGVYIWSGIHKFNPYFPTIIFESILVDGLGITDVDTVISLKHFAFVIPITEILMGVFLLWKKTQRIGIVLAVLTHLSILYYVLFGLHGNFVILPWNLLMMYALIFLFLDQKEAISVRGIPSRLKITLVVVLLLPIGFLSGKVDQRISFSLYDGKMQQLYVISDDDSLMYEKQRYLYEDIIESGAIVNFNALSYEELNVPFYAQKRFFNKILKSYNDQENTNVILTRIPLWERNLKATYKSDKEKETFYRLQLLPNIQLKEAFYIPAYEILE